jgi:hypothetical protein
MLLTFWAVAASIGNPIELFSVRNIDSRFRFQIPDSRYTSRWMQLRDKKWSRAAKEEEEEDVVDVLGGGCSYWKPN